MRCLRASLSRGSPAEYDVISALISIYESAAARCTSRVNRVRRHVTDMRGLIDADDNDVRCVECYRFNDVSRDVIYTVSGPMLIVIRRH